jgi:hypothetical protein
MTVGYGDVTEYGMEAHPQVTVAATVYGGTGEVRRDIVGKTSGLGKRRGERL